jgi:iron uptake system component EfeO
MSRIKDPSVSVFSKALSLLVGFTIANSIGVARADVAVPPTEQYRAFLIDEISQALANARVLRGRVEAHDVDGAKKAWIDARVGWERAEVFTSGFVSELDEQIDAWPNALTGFHAIEAKLFGAKTTDIGSEADQLVFHLSDLDIKIRQIPLNAQGLLNGAARLAYEVGESKADGGESRFSGTSLDDMRNNVAGIQLAYKTLFASALEGSDPKLAQNMHDTIQRLTALLSVSNVKALEPDRVRTTSEELIVHLQDAAPKIGLRRPTLEDITQ